MLENISGIKIKGKYFFEETHLVFFPKPKDRLSMVFGRNGSGKSTITEGFRSYKQNEFDEIFVSLMDNTNHNIQMDDKYKSDHIYVFNENYVDENIRLSLDGLNTIILFGEQGNIDKDIGILESRLNTEKAKEKNLLEKAEKYMDSKNTVSYIYHLEQIKKILKQDGGWAEKDSKIKGNKTKTNVNDSTALKICEKNSKATITELENEYKRIETLLKKHLYQYLSQIKLKK